MSTQSESVGKLQWRNWLNLVAYALNSVVTYTSLTGIFGETNSALSDKYQTLVTPNGWAFSIWGPIFIWEGVFAFAQLLSPSLRGAPAVAAASPWWWGACLFQCLWTIAFAQEVIPLSLLCMLGILACLLGLSLSTDGLTPTWAQYLCLRAPFSLHLGWILAASAVNANVQLDAMKASASTLLAGAVLAFVVVGAVNASLVAAASRPDPIVALVATWAFAGVASGLADGAKLANPSRFNPYDWPQEVLDGLQAAAIAASVGAAALAAAALARNAARDCRRKQHPEASDARATQLASVGSE